jgi:hypothetical protein
VAGSELEGAGGVAASGRRLVVAGAMAGRCLVLDLNGGGRVEFGEDLLERPMFIDVSDEGLICVSDAVSMSIEVFQIEIASED